MTAEDELQDRIAQAIGDPGSFLPRGDNYQESITRWSTRAVMTLVDPLADRLEAVRAVCDEADAAWAAWPLTSRIRAALSAAPQPEPERQAVRAVREPARCPHGMANVSHAWGRWLDGVAGWNCMSLNPEPPASDEPARCADCHRPLPHTEPEQRACWAATHASGTPDGGP